jgi:PqqD family protein of HPr-rel-A system
LWAQWDDGYSVFNVDTGDTHMLTELAATVLQALTDEPRSVGWLAETTAEACGICPEGKWHRKIAGLVDTLAELELVELVTSETAPPNKPQLLRD